MSALRVSGFRLRAPLPTSLRVFCCVTVRADAVPSRRPVRVLRSASPASPVPFFFLNFPHGLWCVFPRFAASLPLEYRFLVAKALRVSIVSALGDRFGLPSALRAELRKFVPSITVKRLSAGAALTGARLRSSSGGGRASLALGGCGISLTEPNWRRMHGHR